MIQTKEMSTIIPTQSNSILACKIKQPTFSILVVNLYLPAVGTEENEEALEEMTNLVLNHPANQPVIIGGDLNMKPNHPLILDLCNQLNLQIHYPTNPTWHGPNSLSSTIDYYLSNARILNVEVIPNPDNHSDHEIIEATIDLPAQTPKQNHHTQKPPNIRFEAIEHYHIKMFHDHLQAVLPSLPPSGMPLDEFYRELTSKLKHSAIATLPSSKSRLEGKRKRLSGWTPEFTRLKQESQAAHHQLLQFHPDDPLYTTHLEVFQVAKKKYRATVQRLRREQETLSQERLAEHLTNSNNPSSKTHFWKKIKARRNFQSKNPIIINGATTQKESVDILTTQLLPPTLHTSDTIDVPLSQINWCTPKTIETAIMKLSNKTDYENLHAKILKYASPVISNLLASFFNQLTISKIPTKLVTTQVTPILKKGKDPNQASSYRPISNSPMLYKLLESSLQIHLHPYLHTNPNQHAYKRNTSTTTCTNSYKRTVSHYTHYGSSVYAALLDLSKAFDRVDQELLFTKLKERNLPPNIITLLKRLYQEAKLYMKINNEKSEPLPTTAGVRQGGILSPVLFNIYLDSLFLVLQETQTGCYIGPRYSSCHIYADDIVLLAPSSISLQLLLRKAKNHLENDLKLTLNVAKTQIITHPAASSHTPPPTPISLNEDEFLSWKDSVTHLGHEIDSNIDNNCQADIERARKSFANKSYSIIRSFRKADTKMLSFLVRTYAGNLYGLQTWNPAADLTPCSQKYSTPSYQIHPWPFFP